MKRFFISFFLIAILSSASFSQPIIKKSQKAFPSSFAIFVDSQTFQKIGKSIDAYKNAVEADGISTNIVIDDWKNPDEIRAIIIDLYQKKPPLEGVVFVGDIPIPMIRDAQHLTSAFKMDQQGHFSWQRSSVPSDRFYEDFDLKFKYLKQDSSNQLLFYYSLRFDSPQFIEKEIYSGRIFPPAADETKYGMMENYLERIIREKKQKDQLNNAMFVTGHGYYSESLNAWEGELTSLREQFPQFYQPGGMIKNYYHLMSTELKQTILNELQVEPLDLVVFHAHGDVDEQLLLGNPPLPTINSQIDAVKFFLRNRLRSAKRRNKSVAETQLDYKERLGIPLDWFDGAFNDSLSLADSLMTAQKDIYISDIENISPRAELIIFDECFNGAFFSPPYVAGNYVFGDGTTVASLANTVNIKQDSWANEFLGLLELGVRLGFVHKMNNYLETHIIGDPTFHFQSRHNLNINQLLFNGSVNIEQWESFLTKPDVPLRNLAVFMLSQKLGSKFEQRLIEIYETDPSFIVRMQAIKSLATLRSASFEKILLKSANDPYEFIRRTTVSLMGDVGKAEYVPSLLQAIFTDPSKRIVFNARNALSKIEPKLEHKESFIQKLSKKIQNDDLARYIKEVAFSKSDWIQGEVLPKIINDSLTVKKRINAIRTFRNYRIHSCVPDLIAVAKNPRENIEIRKTAIEALGWFTVSYQRFDIIEACDQILKPGQISEQLKDEALKTKNRLLHGANNPITP